MSDDTIKKVEFKGRPELSNKQIALMLMYKMKNTSANKTGKILRISPNSVGKYWKMYDNDEIAQEVVDMATDLYEKEMELTALGQELQIQQDNTLIATPEEESFVPVTEIISPVVLAKMVNASIKVASGLMFEESITAKAIKKQTGDSDLKTSFGFALDTEDGKSVCITMKKMPPDSKPFMTLVDFLKKNDIDILASAKKELGLKGGVETDLLEMNADEACSQYQQEIEEGGN